MEETIMKITNQEEVLSHFPKILYKYRDWENDYHKKIITNKEIYFPCFSELNDEFDGQQPFRFDNSNVSFEKHKKVLKSTNKNEFDKLTNKELNQMYQKFQSGQDWKEYYSQHIKIINKFFGVYSFAKTNDNQQLWGLYANSNKGFCIGFETSEIYNSIIGFDKNIAQDIGIDINFIAQKNGISTDNNIEGLFKPTLGYVTYDDNPILMPFTDKLSFYDYQNLFFTKKKKWEYEEEIRMLKLFASKKTFIINKNSIREIIFGVGMSQEHKNEIIEEIESAGFENVCFYEVAKNIETLIFEINEYLK